MLSLSILSLAGIPPLAGFWGKLLVFMAAYRAGANWLLAIALAMTVVALAYYLRLLRVIWTPIEATDESAAPEPIPVAAGHLWALGIASALIVLIGLIPAPLWGIFEQVTVLAGS
jgi:NADH-quinone oxidoreductase subunit N